MADENAVSEFLKGLGEDKSQFSEEQKSVFTDTGPDREDDDEDEVVDEKPLPFHKDPKVQRYVEKQIAKALEGVKKEPEQQKQTEGDDATFGLPESFVELVGNDTPEKRRVLKDLSVHLSSLEERGAQKALQTLSQQSQRQAEEDRRAQEELDEAFENIEETFNVDLSSNAASAKKTRSEFIDFVRKIAPKNEEGEVIAFPDLTAAFEEYQERSKQSKPVNRAKELSARSMSRSNETSTTPTGGKSWKDVERLFSSLT